jgi:hypothetical protein
MLRSRFCFCVLCAALTLFLAWLHLTAPREVRGETPPPGPVSFINDVAPILKDNCFACHDAKKRSGKLDMTTYENLRKGGTKDDPIAAGKPEESVLVDLISATDNTRMPPPDKGDALAKEKIAIIEQWIKEGATIDDGFSPKTELRRELRLRRVPPPPPAAYPFPVAIRSVAFTPDNQKLVVGGQHELTVWNVADGKLEKRITTRAERALALVFLPDGKLAVAGGWPGQEGDVKIYDLAGGTPKMEDGVAVLDGVNDKGVMIKQLLGADDDVWCLAVSADGKKLASGGSDRLVNVWDLNAGYENAKLEQTIENHADWVFGVAFSPDGKHLVTGSRDKTAKLWDLTTKESVLTFPDHQNSVYGVALKPDGKQGFSVGEDNQIRAWNTSGDQAGKQIRNFGGHGKAIFKVLQHPTQPLLITCSADATVRVWNEDSGSQVRVLGGHTDWVYSLALSPDGNLIAAGAYNGAIKVWKVADGALVTEFNGSPGYTPAAR